MRRTIKHYELHKGQDYVNIYDLKAENWLLTDQPLDKVNTLKNIVIALNQQYWRHIAIDPDLA